MTNVVWNLAPKELNHFFSDAALTYKYMFRPHKGLYLICETSQWKKQESSYPEKATMSKHSLQKASKEDDLTKKKTKTKKKKKKNKKKKQETMGHNSLTW